MPTENPFDVFLSHNSKDKPMVRQLGEALQARGLTVWLDEWELVPGRAWQEALEEIITTTKSAAVLIGKDGLGPWETPEMRGCLSEFVKRKLPVIPVLLPDAPSKPNLPLFLRAFTWVDLRDGLTKDGIDRLEWGITGVKTKKRKPGRPATLPSTPQGSATMKAPVDFVIVTALEEERDAVLSKLPGHRRVPPAGNDVRVYFECNLAATFSDGRPCTYKIIAVTLQNMGRVEAANATGDAIRRWSPRFVVLVGIAGGIADAGVKLGDLLVSDQIVDYELQKVTKAGPQIRFSVHRADPSLLAAAKNYLETDWHSLVAVKRPGRGKPQRKIGPIATGDKVIAFKKVLDRYREHWPKLIGVEMEAGGVASACFQANPAPGFFMVRAVSDLADEQKDSATVDKWRRYVCDVAAAYTIGLMKAGPVLAAVAPPIANESPAAPPKRSGGGDVTKIRRESLERQLTSLVEEYAAVKAQWEATLSDADRIRLKRKLERLETEMEQVYKELNVCG